MSADVPVEVAMNGTPAPGFVVKGAPVADPTEVRAQGPKSEVMMIQSVRTASFDVAGLDEGKHTAELPIERPPGRVAFDGAPIGDGRRSTW